MVWDIRGQEFRPLWKHYYQGNGDGLSEGLDWLSSALSGPGPRTASIRKQKRRPGPVCRLSLGPPRLSLATSDFDFKFRTSDFDIA